MAAACTCTLYRAQIDRDTSTYENRLCPYMAVNVVPNSQRCQEMNPHLTAIYISSYRCSAHVKKALSSKKKLFPKYTCRNSYSGTCINLCRDSSSFEAEDVRLNGL